MKHVALIDGNNLFSRLYFAPTPIENKFEFLIEKTLELKTELNKYKFIFTFDISKSKRKKEIYPAYKEGRKKLEGQEAEDFYELLGDYQEMIRQSGCVMVGGHDYEADDYIAVLTKLLKKSQKVLIISTDGDFHQLVDKNVSHYIPKTKLIIDTENFEEVIGVEKKHFMDMKCMAGDTSDNVQGIKGVGEKTAIKYIKQCGGGYEEIIKSLKEKKKLTKTDEKFLNGKDDFELAKKIIDLSYYYKDSNIKDIIKQSLSGNKFNKENMFKLLSKYELSYYLKKLERLRLYVK